MVFGEKFFREKIFHRKIAEVLAESRCFVYNEF